MARLSSWPARLKLAPGEGMAPLFARPDGELIRGESRVRRMMPYLMRGRNESAVVHEARYDLSRTLPWLDSYTRAGHHASVFSLLLCAIARTLHARPGLNRFVSGGRLYQRQEVSLSFAVKVRFEDAAPLVAIKLGFPPGEDFAVSLGRIEAAVARARSGASDLVDKELRLALALPGFLVRALMKLLRGLDRVNLMPGRLIDADPLYTSVFAANLGSLGLSRTSHHLYEYGTASVFAAMGAVEKLVFPGLGGRPVFRDGLEVRWTLDERIQDGHHCAASLALLKQAMEDPASQFGPDPRLVPNPR